MRSRLIRIGNSRGVRIPKTVIEEVGLEGELELQVRGATVVISAPKSPRSGWAEAARRMHEAGEDRLLDKETPTRFDREEWRWR